jgi:quercetin dioxygenase-like cupin family protein
MHNPPSSCDVTNHSGDTASPVASRVLRWQPGFRWDGVPVEAYKSPADHWCGIQRMSLAGEHGEQTAFHVRYFEMAPGGFSSLEHHAHEHVVVVLRGRGEVRLGDVVHALGFGDVVYVAPHKVHQFRNAADEPFGFLCMVDARRDAPVPVTPHPPS